MAVSLFVFLIFLVNMSRFRCSAIVNGLPVKIKDAGWTVALIHEKTGDLVCTAFLVELDWAITAAQCVEKFGIFDVLFVLAGLDTMENRERGEKAYVTYWHIHPCYAEKNAYDIALLKLSFKLSASKASSIKLSASPWPAEIDQRKCDTIGWGSNMVDTGNIDVLRKATIATAHGSDGCPCTMSFDQKRLVCSANGGSALCKRDFGGVLICDGNAVAIAHLLVSTTCSDAPVTDCRDKSVISSYVFICPFLDWIKQFVPSVPNKPTSCFSPSLVSTGEVHIWLVTVLIAVHSLYQTDIYIVY